MEKVRVLILRVFEWLDYCFGIEYFCESFIDSFDD